MIEKIRLYQEQGYGVAKGIPTLVIAAASMDDVLAISAFTILLGITFTTEESSDVVSLVFKVSVWQIFITKVCPVHTHTYITHYQNVVLIQFISNIIS